MDWSPDQLEAVEKLPKALRSGVRDPVLTGWAGCGKTTLLRHFSDKMTEDGWYVFWAAPTGKAASRLSAVTGQPAATIHSILYSRVTTGRQGQPLFGGRRASLLDGRRGLLCVDEACLSYTSRVMLADGSWKYIGEIVSQRLPVEVLSWNRETGAVESKKVVGWARYKSSGQVIRISASRARNRERMRQFRCTENHKIFMADGSEKLAKDVSVGDDVLVRGRFLTPLQRSFLLGSLLGDCSVSNTSAGQSAKFVHGKKQLRYLEFKRSLFPDSGQIYEVPSGYKVGGVVCGFSTPRIDDLEQIREMAYPNGKKAVCQWWLDQVDEVGLAAWYMDDGHLDERVSNYVRKDGSRGVLNHPFVVYLHTEGFDVASCRKLSSWLGERWGVRASVSFQKGRPRIYINGEQAEKFLRIVAPFVGYGLEYKIPESMRLTTLEWSKQSYLETGSYPIVEKEEESYKKYGYVYDIEVEDNHNYFTSNVLVSNSMVGKRLYDDLMAAANTSVQVLFAGDPGQLPPVADQLGPALYSPTAQLSTVHRQALESPVLLVATEVRQGIRMRRESIGDQYVRRPGSVADAADWIGERLSVGGDAVALTATNKVRQNINRIVRRNLSYTDAVHPGEQLVVLLNNKHVGKMNGETIRVESCSPVCGEDGEETGLFRILSEGEVYFVHGPTIGGEMSAFLAMCARLDHVRDRRQFLHVDYGYALTVHKSQGSEFREVCFVVDDHLRWRAGKDAEDVKRLAYTAITRAKEKLFVLDV